MLYKNDVYKVEANSKEEAVVKINKLKMMEATAMSKMIPSETGLATVIWVDAEKAYKKGKHAKRIKFKGGKSNSSRTFTSIMLKNAELVDETLPKKKSDRIDEATIEEIKTWVSNNEYALDKMADTLITQIQFSKILIKGKNKASDSAKKKLKEKVDSLVQENTEHKW